MSNTIKNKVAALGDTHFTFAVYIANRPALPEYDTLNTIMPLKKEQISLIGSICGNGWRKVFNVYAKLLYALDSQYFHFSQCAATWQQYRDQFLLQANSGTALIFSAPCLELTSAPSSQVSPAKQKIIHIICGRTYAKKLMNEGLLEVDLLWLDDEFAIDFKSALIVCPYFDYRQLSNQKILYLSSLLSAMVTDSEETRLALLKIG